MLRTESRDPTRRAVLRGLGVLLAAPAIVRASSLMPVRQWVQGRLWDYPTTLNLPYPKTDEISLVGIRIDLKTVYTVLTRWDWEPTGRQAGLLRQHDRLYRSQHGETPC